MIFGVSPAWFLSLFGESFSIRQSGESLGRLKDMGYTVWQPEVFLHETLNKWTSGEAETLRLRSNDLGLITNTFVAHFLGNGFINEFALGRSENLIMLERLLGALESWTEISIIVIPLPAFEIEAQVDADKYRRCIEAISSKLTMFASRIESSGRRLALEAMTGNLTGCSAHLSGLLEREGLENIGINYDSGHFHAAGESHDLVLVRLGTRIVCTHLCDNNSIQNLSLAPGKGTILWSRVLSGLNINGYRGPYDIEIRCPAENVDTEYANGLEYIKRCLLKESA